jgi:hypothetical protein
MWQVRWSQALPPGALFGAYVYSTKALANINYIIIIIKPLMS